ncbi:MAG: hypothetical protein ACXWYS_01450 [Gaiellaceae bacterium]
MKWSLIGVAAASVAALLPAAASRAAGPATTAPPPVTTIKIIFTDSRVSVHPKRGQRGNIAQFVLLNRGSKPHTFRLGHTQRGTGAQTGFTKALKPNEQSVQIFFLDYRGKLPYSSPLPYDRTKAGMKGTFTIF